MKRINNLRNRMQAAGIQALLLTSMTDIYYISGFTGSTAYILLTPKKNIFITDGRYESQVKDEIGKEFELRIAARGYYEELLDAAAGLNNIWIGSETPVGIFRLFDNEGIHVFVTEQTPIQKMRTVKDDNEIELIRKSFVVAGEALLQSLENFEYGQSESGWAALLEYNMKKRGAKEPSFETIVASGHRGALPHGMASDKIIGKGDPVVIDFGAKCEYCSDITRMVYDGDDAEVLKVISIVREAQLKSVEKIKAGVTCREIDSVARDHITKAGYGEYFNHSLGHSLGIDVHERPVFSFRDDTVLEKNMVLTVEPGIYLPGKFGVRLEDTIVVDENGCVNLTAVLDKYHYSIL